MTAFTVSSTAALLSALKSAKSGDTVLLKSGTYSSVNIRDIKIAGNVTIASADPDKQAVFADMMVKNSSGLTFRNIEMAGTSKSSMYDFTTFGSSNITFDHINVHGTLNDSPADDVSLFMVRSSRNVTVTNSEFSQQWHALSILDNDGLVIKNNRFHDLRTDGVRGGGNSNVLIDGNTFTDYYPADGDHPDGIQLWTTATTETARNITITNNIVTRGSGAPVQGIFLRDTFDQLPFENVTITNNVVIGAMYNGISVDGAKGLKITNNQVVAAGDQKSWIRVERATDARVADNSATDYIYIDNGIVTKQDNLVTKALTSDVAMNLASWVEGHAATATGLSQLLATKLNQSLSKLAILDQSANSLVAMSTMKFEKTIIQGTDGVDRLTVAAVGSSRLEGGAGNDVLTGGVNGENELVGGTGDDTYTVKGIGDRVIEAAGEGNDIVNTYIDYTLTENVEQLRLSVGGLIGHGNALDNRLIGSAGDDILYGEGGDDAIQGGDGNDTLHGGDGVDTIKGDDGNDVIYGDAGNDKLYGNAGNDIIYGGAGSDFLEGGQGADTLHGGAGADTFSYRAGDFDGGIKASMDVIADFSSKEGDRIGLAGIDANSLTAADDKFRFIGTGAFTKTAGELRYQVTGGDSYVSGDVNGDGVADFMIKLVGVTSLKAADFLL